MVTKRELRGRIAELERRVSSLELSAKAMAREISEAAERARAKEAEAESMRKAEAIAAANARKAAADAMRRLSDFKASQDFRPGYGGE